MTTCKQLDAFFNELLEKKVEISRKWPEEEIKEIGEAVTAMVHQVVSSALEHDAIFRKLSDLSKQRKKKADQANAGEKSVEASVQDTYELVPVGSVAEGTKVGKPDERDMLLMLNLFSTLGLAVSDTVYDTKHPFYKFVYLKDDDEDAEKLSEILKEPSVPLVVKTEDGPFVFASAAFSAYFLKMLKTQYENMAKSEYVISKQSGQLKAKETKGEMMNEMGKFTDVTDFIGPQSVIKRTGPAITLTSVWKSTASDRHTLIDVDIVPNIVVKTQNDDRPPLFGKYANKERVHLIPVKTLSSLNKFAQKGVSTEQQKIHMLSFLPSFSNLEVQMMKAIPANCRQAYKVLKHFMSKQFSCSCCQPSSFSFGFIVQSYLMKTMIIRHGHESESCDHSGVSVCVIFILEEFRTMAHERKLSVKSLWNADHNLFYSKPVTQLEQRKPAEWEKEITSFEKHLSYLLERFHEINLDDMYSFEKYKEFPLKISNREKRAAYCQQTRIGQLQEKS